MPKAKEKENRAASPPEDAPEKKKRVFRRRTITTRNVARSFKSSKPVFRGKPLVRDAREYLNTIIAKENIPEAEQIQYPRNIRSEFKRGMSTVVGTVLVNVLNFSKEVLDLHNLDRLSPKILQFATKHVLKHYGFKYKFKLPVLPDDAQLQE